MSVVMGQIAHPVGRANPYRIGHDGVPRILPAGGGFLSTSGLAIAVWVLRVIMWSRGFRYTIMIGKSRAVVRGIIWR